MYDELASPVDPDFFQRGDDIIADAARVGNRAVLAHPDAFINTTAKVFGKLTIDVPADLRARLVRVNDEPAGFHDCGRWNRAGSGNLALSNRMLGTGTTRQKTEAEDTGNGDEKEWFHVHGGNSKLV